jgi:hypothetical protein
VADRPLRPATDRRLGELLPLQLANRPQAHPLAPPGLRQQALLLALANQKPMRSCRRFLAGIPHLGVGDPRVTHPSATPCSPVRKPEHRTCDLHVLGTPPAFILSQDQTRHPVFYPTNLSHERSLSSSVSSDPGHASRVAVRRFIHSLSLPFPSPSLRRDRRSKALTGDCSYFPLQLLFVLLSTLQLSRYFPKQAMPASVSPF